MRPLRLLIADDHPLLVEAVELVLEHEPDFEIVGAAGSGSELLPLARRTEPDLVVLDLLMPGIDGLSCVKLLRRLCPRVRIAVLTGVDSEEMTETALEAGADAYILKSIEPTALAGALRQVGEKPLAGAIGRPEIHRPSAVELAGLTGRELEVLRALAQGKSNKEIAHTLWLAEQTVKFHLTHVYGKLGVRNRTGAIYWAYNHGLADMVSPTRTRASASSTSQTLRG